jgi:hypothetical protein
MHQHSLSSRLIWAGIEFAALEQCSIWACGPSGALALAVTMALAAAAAVAAAINGRGGGEEWGRVQRVQLGRYA